MNFWKKKLKKLAAPPALQTEDYRRFAQVSPWTDQGKDYLADERAFTLWVKRFRPEKDDKLPRGLGFEVIPPASYPAIVIYARVRRMGLTECEFYWDYVTLKDFDPIASTEPKLQQQPIEPGEPSAEPCSQTKKGSSL